MALHLMRQPCGHHRGKGACTRPPTCLPLCTGRRTRCWAVSAEDKEVWVSTNSQAVLTAGLEAGVRTFVFVEHDSRSSSSSSSSSSSAAICLDPDSAEQIGVTESAAALGHRWSSLGRFRSLLQDSAGRLLDLVTGQQVGAVHVVASAAQLLSLQSWAEQQGGTQVGSSSSSSYAASSLGTSGTPVHALSAASVVVMDAQDWKVIPAENLIATFASAASRNGRSAALMPRLFAAVGSASEARVMLEVLECGTDGVLLRTNDAEQVRNTMAYVSARASASTPVLSYCRARVTRVAPVGPCGDRVCVDLAVALRPGEGLLVGSQARCLFLVHSECDSSAYISSRPFRVNAGPVHAYVMCPNGRTAYLSELRAGCEVLVVDAAGRGRAAVVGRAKIESRPLVLVEAMTPDGAVHSILLQNAETVKLVGPIMSPVACVDLSEAPVRHLGAAEEAAAAAGRAMVGGNHWRTISVSNIGEGDEVLVLLQGGARHTGIAITEAIEER